MEKFELETLDIDTINNFAEGLPGGFFIYKAFAFISESNSFFVEKQ